MKRGKTSEEGEQARDEMEKDVNGKILRDGVEVRRRWEEYFEQVLNVENVREANIDVVGNLPMPAWLLLLLLLLKKVGSARLRESGIHPISPKTPAPQYQPIDRKKRTGKKVEDYSRDRAA